jgi:hypothetical protein
MDLTFGTIFTFPSCSFPPNRSLIFSFIQNSFLRLHMTAYRHRVLKKNIQSSLKMPTKRSIAERVQQEALAPRMLWPLQVLVQQLLLWKDKSTGELVYLLHKGGRFSHKHRSNGHHDPTCVDQESPSQDITAAQAQGGAGSSKTTAPQKVA